MELKTAITKRHQKDYQLFCLTMILWIVLSIWLESANYSLTALELTFLVGVGAAPLLIYKSFEDIDTLPVLTKQRDVFSMTMAFLIATIASDLFLRLNLQNASEDFSTPAMITSIGLGLVIITGYGLSAFLLWRYERKKKVVLDCTDDQATKLMKDLRILQADDRIQYLTRANLEERLAHNTLNEIDLIVISREGARSFHSDLVLLRAHLAGVPIIDAQEITNKITGHISLNQTELSSYLLGATQKTLLCRVLLRTRHTLEPFVALIMALLAAPLLILIAILIKCFSPGPVLYLQTRTGYLGRQFKLVKFRSMRLDAEQNGPQWSSLQDTRVTGIGSFLRRTRLDELPQFWNVIRGEMSFIGPRPERPEIYKKLETEVPLFSLRTLVAPGITGWAQVRAGYAASSAESLLKLEYDLFYIRHMSVRFDLYILLKTVRIAFVGDESAHKVSVPHPMSARSEMPEMPVMLEGLQKVI